MPIWPSPGLIFDLFIELVMRNPNLGIPALVYGLFAKWLIFNYLYSKYIYIYTPSFSSSWGGCHPWLLKTHYFDNLERLLGVLEPLRHLLGPLCQIIILGNGLQPAKWTLLGPMLLAKVSILVDEILLALPPAHLPSWCLVFCYYHVHEKSNSG